LEYKSESETSAGFILPLYTSSPPTPLPQSPSPIDSPPHYNMSQLNLQEIIRQQQEQLAAMQVQIQALLAVAGGTGTGGTAMESNLGSHMEMAKPAIFNGEAGRVEGFVMAYRSYLRIKMKEGTVKEQII